MELIQELDFFEILVSCIEQMGNVFVSGRDRADFVEFRGYHNKQQKNNNQNRVAKFSWYLREFPSTVSDISIFTTSLGMPIQYQKIQMQIRIKFCFPYRSMKSHERRIIYPPKESSLKNLSEGSHWFECSLYLVLFLEFFGFPLGTRRTYCVVGDGWGVFF